MSELEAMNAFVDAKFQSTVTGDSRSFPTNDAYGFFKVIVPSVKHTISNIMTPPTIRPFLAVSNPSL